MLEILIGNQRGIGLFLLRLILGIIFFAHGMQKVFSISETTTSFQEMHIPFAGFMVWFIAIAEFIGGVCLIVGYLTREFAFLFILIMMGAIIAVHGSNGFFMGNGGFEYNFALIGMCLALLLGGGGISSIDAVRHPKPKWEFVKDRTSIKLEPPEE